MSKIIPFPTGAAPASAPQTPPDFRPLIAMAPFWLRAPLHSLLDRMESMERRLQALEQQQG